MWLLLFAIAVVVLWNIRINGDGGEYLMTTHALFRHASVLILPSDFSEFSQRPFDELNRMGYPREFYDILLKKFQRPHPMSWGGFASVRPDELYSMHFWLYSLLALPYYAVVHTAGLNPVWAFGLLNMTFVAASCAYLRRAMPQNGHWAVILFLALGTPFYLRWTGPEVMSAGCALVATVALLRGKAGQAILLSGIGATQTPSLILIAPFAIAFRILLRRYPNMVWPGVTISRFGVSDVLMATSGLAVALVPYVFFYSIFEEPSLTGRYFTRHGLISFQRLSSLFFDLNQGMLVGVPGLFVGLPAALCFFEPGKRREMIWISALIAGVCVALLIPVLATLNWNSGGVVFMRYAYWISMPLLALIFRLLQNCEPKMWIRLVSLILLVQSIVAIEHGVLGQRSSTVRFSIAANWVLNNFPAHYNPDPEIFFERGSGQEVNAPLSHELTYLYPPRGKPLKLLRHRSNTSASNGLCSGGQLLEGSSVHQMKGGWDYLHAPFTCRPLPRLIALGEWRFDAMHAQSKALLLTGWSGLEASAVWTQGKESILLLPVSSNGRKIRLAFRGGYYRSQNKSELIVNGKYIGFIDLREDSVLVPADIGGVGLTVTLRHSEAASPVSYGESADTRQLGFYLSEIIAVELDESGIDRPEERKPNFVLTKND